VRLASSKKLRTVTLGAAGHPRGRSPFLFFTQHVVQSRSLDGAAETLRYWVETGKGERQAVTA
jgi:hypothetical protein